MRIPESWGYARPRYLLQNPTAILKKTDPLSKMERNLANLTHLMVLSSEPKPRPHYREQPADGEWGSDTQGTYQLKRDGTRWYKYRATQMCVLNGDLFMRSVKKENRTTYSTSIFEIDRFIQQKRVIDDPAWEPLPRDEKELREEALRTVPPEYHEEIEVFSKYDSNTLPEHRPCDHKIELEEGHRPEELGYSPLCKMSLDELEAVRKYILENLSKGFIEASSSPWAAPVLFVKKADGSLRFCVNYRKLNAITRKDRYPLPLIEETLAKVAKAQWFTKVDIRQAFHRIRMRPEDEELTTFRTGMGAFKYKVLPFGLINGPASFQSFINSVLGEYLGDFCTAYIDDILIYSDTLKEHEDHVKKVLRKLKDAGLQADLKKCEFHVTKTKFLGFIVGREGVTVDPEKVEVVKEWAVPSNLRGVQSFLGFCNFYRKFIKDHGRVARPLTNLTRKGEAFTWTDRCQAAFEELKRLLVEAPLLRHFRYDAETRVETDASDGVLAGVLSQLQEDTGEWHPVAFFSETMQNAEHNYPIHDKELLAVIRALQTWRPELIGLRQNKPFTIITDHQALEYFGTKRLLNLRQAGWAEFLSQYYFEVTYRPGTKNAAADALSRKSEDLKTQKDKKDAYRTLQIFKPVEEGGVEVSATASISTDKGLVKELVPIMMLDKEGLELSPVEPEGYKLVDALMKANRENESLEEYRIRAHGSDPNFVILANGLLVYQDRLIVPESSNLRTRIIDEAHSTLTTAHPGRNKTRAILKTRYWWPRMAGDIDRFVKNCMVCKASKVPKDKTPGLLHPIPPPARKWSSIVMDFKKMPRDKHGFDNALVMVDRLSKSSWVTPCTENATARDAARMYYEGPYRVHGMPEEVISDRGPQFTSAFTDEMSKLTKTKWKLATAGHSQTTGQAEVMNAYIDQRLRPFVNHYQDDWSEAIPALDAVQNSLPQDSVGLSPHEIMFGHQMRMPFDWEARTQDPSIPRTEQLTREQAHEYAQRIRGYVEFAREMMLKAQEQQAAQANKKRREPDFEPGDRVIIVKRLWSTTTRPSDKLDFPNTRNHYEIIEKVGHSYRLELPQSWKGTDVFHADRLRKYDNNPLPGQALECPGPVNTDEDGDPEWEVDRVTASKVANGKLFYQADWKGWDPDPEWYPASDFKHAPKALWDFHEANPDAPGPPRRLMNWLNEDTETHDDDEYPETEGLRRSRRITRKK